MASWGEMLGAFLVPAILRNVAGGVLLVALLNYGQMPEGAEQIGGRRRQERAGGR